MANRRWLVPLALLGAAVVYRQMRQAPSEQFPTAARAFSTLHARLYDALSGLAMERVYARVAREAVALVPTGMALDVGCGPGRLAVRLAREGRELGIVGLDISPEMIELATRRAESAGLAHRVRFEVGDAAEMPFDDDQFDLVVSTLSMHHWADQHRVLAEIRRVLKPDGQACIYDVADWFLRGARHGSVVSLETAASIIGGEGTESVWRLGPVPVMRRMCLRRPASR